RGTGLGLSMVFGFVKQSRGHIKIYSEVGHGTTIRVYLPRAGAAAPVKEKKAATPAEPPQRRETILVVEDDPEVRRTVIQQLAGLRYRVVEAANPRAALAHLEDPAVAVDLLFTDIVMPGGMNVHDLARAALALRPELTVLYTSGYSASALRNGDRVMEGEHFLSKPYRKEELARKLDEVFERAGTMRP